MMTSPLIPTTTGETLRTRARKGRMMKLENLLDLRDLLKEYEVEKVKINMEAFYQEASDWMDTEPSNVRDGLGIIREYTKEYLYLWINKGLTFNHIATANWLATVEDCKHKEPIHLLNDAIRLGGENGERMTVNEMITYALGEKVPRPRTFAFVKVLSNWIVEIPQKLGWTNDKRQIFEARVRDLIDMIEERN